MVDFSQLTEELSAWARSSLKQEAYEAAVAYSAAQELVGEAANLEELKLVARACRTNRRRSTSEDEYLAWDRSYSLVQDRISRT